MQAPLGRVKLLGSALRRIDRSGADRYASAWNLAAHYALSTSSTLYASYGRISDRQGAGYAIANVPRAGTRALHLGVRHGF